MNNESRIETKASNNHVASYGAKLVWLLPLLLVLSIVLIAEVNSLRKELEKTRTASDEALQNVPAAVVSSIEKWLASLEDDVHRNLSGRWDRMQGAAAIQAADSLALAVQSLDKGDAQLALVYFINAINHDPTSLEALEALMELVKKNHKDAALRDEVRSVMAISQFKTAPEHVETVAGYLAELDRLDAESLANIPAAPETTPQKRLADIKEAENLAQLPDDGAMEETAGELAELQAIRAEVSDDAPNPQFRHDLDQAIQQYENALEAAVIIKEVTNYLDLLDRDDPNGDVAQGRFLAASSALVALWRYDLSALPDRLRTTAMGLPGRLAAYEDNINAARADHVLEELKQTALNIEYALETGCGVALRKGTAKRQAEILKLSACRDIVMLRLPEIRHAGHRDETLALLEKIGDAINKSRQEQYKAYQRWAAELLAQLRTRMALTGYLFSKEEANDILRRSNLWEIDLRLVAPEVAEVYAILKHKLSEKLSGKQLPGDIERKLMTAYKRSLEEF